MIQLFFRLYFTLSCTHTVILINHLSLVTAAQAKAHNLYSHCLNTDFPGPYLGTELVLCKAGLEGLKRISL